MKVNLKLMATYRDNLPEEAEGGAVDLEVDPGTSVADLVASFGVPVDKTTVILVNGLTPQPEQILSEGDAVAAFPAMAGG